MEENKQSDNNNEQQTTENKIVQPTPKRVVATRKPAIENPLLKL